MDVGFKTDRGKRRANNEDACYVMKNDNVFIVADGVGGNNSGEIASRTAVNEIAKYIEEHKLEKQKTPRKIKEFFQESIKTANLRVLEMSERFEENKGMATTLVVAYVYGNTLYISNVGDSRAYIFRGEGLEQITEDHTYVNTLLKEGIISEEEAETHENKNMITRAVGAELFINSDFFSVPIDSGNVILICTDGLYGEIGEDRLIEEFREDKSMMDVCNDLVDEANKNGGHDNITLVCLKITEEDVK